MKGFLLVCLIATVIIANTIEPQEELQEIILINQVNVPVKNFLQSECPSNTNSCCGKCCPNQQCCKQACSLSI